MAKKQRSESNKNYFNNYPTKAAKNRQRRLEKHQKRHPNDKQGGSTSYRRKTPQNESGWLTAEMDSELTPKQVTPIVDKKSKEEFIPECAKSLRDMTKAERKEFAQIYSKIRKLHKQPKAKTKSKSH